MPWLILSVQDPPNPLTRGFRFKRALPVPWEPQGDLDRVRQVLAAIQLGIVGLPEAGSGRRLAVRMWRATTPDLDDPGEGTPVRVMEAAFFDPAMATKVRKDQLAAMARAKGVAARTAAWRGNYFHKAKGSGSGAVH